MSEWLWVGGCEKVVVGGYLRMDDCELSGCCG